MYPYPILFGVMGIYDILLVLAVIVCLFGADRMVIAAMILILLVLLGGRKRICI